MAIEAGAPVSAIRVDGSLVYKGAIDAASPPDLTSAKKGDYYKISGAGTLAGVAVQVDDSIIFNQDASSPLTSAMFDVIDSSALGTASAEDVGTAIGDVVQLENVGGSAGLPAVDGSQLQNVTATIADASETVKGAIEIATNAEAAAGTATDKALVPSNVSSLSIGSGQVTGLATVATSGAYSDLSGTPSTATSSAEGLVELADNTEAAAGTATDRALTPSNVSSLSIGSGQITGLATVATSGAYSDLSGTPTTATETTEGIIETATNVEAAAGSATDKALVPSNVSSLSIGSGQVTGLATVATSGAYADLSGTPTTATETTEGIIETATNAEATAGTATDKALVPSNISSISIGQLSNVDLTGISPNDLLAYNSTSGNFEPSSPSGVPDASETVKGIIEIATNAEAGAGSATDKALVPSNVSSLSIGSGQVTGLATVATSGAYADLSGTPTTATETTEGIIETATNVEAAAGSATDKALVPSNVSSLSIGSGQVTGLATVATSGAYADLSGTPTTATETTEGIIETATNVEAAAGSATDKALVPSNVSSLSIGSGQVTGLATVATSGAYADLSGIPSTATSSAEGLVELADNTEAAAGTATNRALTPSNISSFSLGSGQVDPVSVSAQSTSFTAAAGNYYRMNPSGSLVVTLPTASAAGDGGEIELKLVTAQIVTINVASASGDLIDGASSYTLDVQWSSIRLKADGSSVWDVL